MSNDIMDLFLRGGPLKGRSPLEDAADLFALDNTIQTQQAELGLSQLSRMMQSDRAAIESQFSSPFLSDADIAAADAMGVHPADFVNQERSNALAEMSAAYYDEMNALQSSATEQILGNVEKQRKLRRIGSTGLLPIADQIPRTSERWMSIVEEVGDDGTPMFRSVERPLGPAEMRQARLEDMANFLEVTPEEVQSQLIYEYDTMRRQAASRTAAKNTQEAAAHTRANRLIDMVDDMSNPITGAAAEAAYRLNVGPETLGTALALTDPVRQKRLQEHTFKKDIERLDDIDKGLRLAVKNPTMFQALGQNNPDLYAVITAAADIEQKRVANEITQKQAEEAWKMVTNDQSYKSLLSAYFNDPSEKMGLELGKKIRSLSKAARETMRLMALSNVDFGVGPQLAEQARLNRVIQLYNNDVIQAFQDAFVGPMEEFVGPEVTPSVDRPAPEPEPEVAPVQTGDTSYIQEFLRWATTPQKSTAGDDVKRLLGLESVSSVPQTTNNTPNTLLNWLTTPTKTTAGEDLISLFTQPLQKKDTRPLPEVYRRRGGREGKW